MFCCDREYQSGFSGLTYSKIAEQVLLMKYLFTLMTEGHSGQVQSVMYQEGKDDYQGSGRSPGD
jgi:hypothetical protein